VVRVGYFEDNDGFQSGFSDQVPKSGYAYEYYQELSKYTGWTYLYVYGSWSDIYKKLENGDVDIMAGMSKLDDRLPYMDFPDTPMGVESYYIFVPATDTTVHSNDPATLNGLRIGVNDHSYMLELSKKFVADHHLDCRVIPYGGTSERMAALANGEIDGIVTVDNYTVSNLKPTFKIGASDYYFAVNRQRPDILRELNEAQNKILSAAPYYTSSLQKKYFGTSIVREALLDEERDWLHRHPLLKMGYLKDALPYCGIDPKTSELTGLLKAILPEIQVFMGVTLQPVGYDSVTDLAAALNKGEIDIIFPAYGDIWSAENQDYVLTSPITSDRIVVLYKGVFQESIYNRIAVSEQSAAQSFFVSMNYPEARQVRCENFKAGIAMLTSGQADSMLLSSNIYNRYFTEYGPFSDLHMASQGSTVNYCFAVRRGNTILYSIFNKSLSSVDPAKINNAIIQYANVETQYSLKKFFEHNAAYVLLFFSGLLLLFIVFFISYRHKTRSNQVRLSDAYQAARNAARAKNDFLSTMSHDMRTPMNAIINLTTLARHDMDVPGKLADDLDKIDTANKFLLGLINDILDMSKIESGHIELKPVVCTLDKFELYIQSVIQPLCDSKHVQFQWQISRGALAVYVDEVRFNQIFFNILSNAVKYSNPGSTVSLRMENDCIEDGVFHVDYVFEDHGIGMSDAFQKKLFQPFERENSGDARMGTGLGLAITKRIIDEMGGSIRIASTIGKGTTVTVHLDLPIPTPEQVGEARQKETATTRSPFVYNFAGRHVLVVEDHPLNREIILRILEECGFSVDIAENGQQAVDVFSNKPIYYFDAILMDVRMPVMSGLEATQKIRSLARPDASSVVIIAMTAEAFEENKKETLSAGMNEHLSKPIDSQLLLATLQRLMP